jgi:two-component system response regulator YesN
VDEIPAIRSYFTSCHELISTAAVGDTEERHAGLQALLEDYSHHIAEEGSLEDCNAWLRAALQAYCSLLASRSRIVRRSLEIVCAEYAGDISLGQIAHRLDVSESHLSRLFSREMGCGFVAYLSRIRVEKARDLLQTTSLKVYEIAERCGFPNVEHFSRTFKKILGHSPSDYR